MTYANAMDDDWCLLPQISRIVKPFGYQTARISSTLFQDLLHWCTNRMDASWTLHEYQHLGRLFETINFVLHQNWRIKISPSIRFKRSTNAYRVFNIFNICSLSETPAIQVPFWKYASSYVRLSSNLSQFPSPVQKGLKVLATMLLRELTSRHCIVANSPASGGRLPHLALFSRTFPQRRISPASSRIPIFYPKIWN